MPVRRRPGLAKAGRHATAFRGGMIDLCQARLDAAGARLDVRTVFGGGHHHRPQAWNVSAGVVGIGGVGDSRSRVPRDPDAPHLTIGGCALFGGFAVVSDVPEDELRGLDEQIRRWARHDPVVSPGNVAPAIELDPGPASWRPGGRRPALTPPGSCGGRGGG